MTEEPLFIKKDWRATFMDALSGDGYTVYAPKRKGGITLFAPCDSVGQVATDIMNTHYPMKQVFFPVTEKMIDFSCCPGEETKSSVNKVDVKTAVLGCRPCDAASISVMDQVFNWDYKDVFYNSRRQNSLIITLGCVESDEKCLCTSVGLAPDSRECSDFLIQEIDGGGTLVSVCSEKGSAFVEAHKDIFATMPADVVAKVADVPVMFDVEKIKPWLDSHFDDEFWEDVALKCLGCGACSYLCPTCHCFDVVDESNWQAGERRRNYDCCSYALFTLHASGHNPRPDQASRCRNRIMHKFRYFVERFETKACVGCGRCIRNCGAGQTLVDILKRIEALAGSEEPAEAKA
jgi:NAD-dependent dihydropyrimidine dehydrogenase PreA subunit